MGKEGAGHFVKTVHNGIEYGDMQLISEAYYIMRYALGMSAQEMHEVFAEWNKGELDSYLIQITSEILAKVDQETKKPMVELIRCRRPERHRQMDITDGIGFGHCGADHRRGSLCPVLVRCQRRAGCRLESAFGPDRHI